MELILFLLAKCVRVFLDIISLAMMLRVILPLFADVDNSPFFMFTVAITEPIVMPVRFILDKLGIGLNTPIDIGFMATYLMLFVIDLLLPAI